MGVTQSIPWAPADTVKQAVSAAIKARRRVGARQLRAQIAGRAGDQDALPLERRHDYGWRQVQGSLKNDVYGRSRDSQAASLSQSPSRRCWKRLLPSGARS